MTLASRPVPAQVERIARDPVEAELAAVPPVVASLTAGPTGAYARARPGPPFSWRLIAVIAIAAAIGVVLATWFSTRRGPADPPVAKPAEPVAMPGAVADAGLALDASAPPPEPTIAPANIPTPSPRPIPRSTSGRIRLARSTPGRPTRRAARKPLAPDPATVADAITRAYQAELYGEVAARCRDVTPGTLRVGAFCLLAACRTRQNISGTNRKQLISNCKQLGGLDLAARNHERQAKND